MNRRNILIVTAGVVVSEIAWYFYKKYKNRVSLPPKEIRSKVFFSSEESVLCKSHLKSGRACQKINCPIRTLNEIKRAIKSAKESLDVCVYFLTHPVLLNAIVEVYEKNVPVRIITDADMSDNTSSTDHILNLRRLGIRLRTKKSDYYMHHKFAVVDKRILITGSTNWTKNGFFGNYENVIITNQADLALAFSNEFDRLWVIFDGTVNVRPQSRKLIV